MAWRLKTEASWPSLLVPTAPQQVRLDAMQMFMKHSIPFFSPLRSHHIQLRDKKKNWLCLFCCIFFYPYRIWMPSRSCSLSSILCWILLKVYMNTQASFKSWSWGFQYLGGSFSVIFWASPLKSRHRQVLCILESMVFIISHHVCLSKYIQAPAECFLLRRPFLTHSILHPSLHSVFI